MGEKARAFRPEVGVPFLTPNLPSPGKGSSPLKKSTIDWATFALKRALSAATAIFGVTTITFAVTHLMSDPIYLVIGTQETDPERIAALRHTFGLDQPLWQQYLTFLNNLIHGNLGVSLFTYQPVTKEIWDRLPNTLELITLAMVLILVWAVPLGCLAAARPSGILDRVSLQFSQFFTAIPGFWLGLLLILIFYSVLHAAPLPIGQLDLQIAQPERITGFLVVDAALASDWSAFGSGVAHLVLPASTIALTSGPGIFQLTRDVMVQVLRSDYIRAARSYGLPARIIYPRYAVPNALVPVMTVVAMSYGWLIGSTVLIETVFAWPGIGFYAVQSIRNSDFSPVMGIVLLTSTIYVVLFLLVDLASFAIDPRTRRQT